MSRVLTPFDALRKTDDEMAKLFYRDGLMGEICSRDDCMRNGLKLLLPRRIDSVNSRAVLNAMLLKKLRSHLVLHWPSRFWP